MPFSCCMPLHTHVLWSQEAVMDVLDHRNLDKDVEYFFTRPRYGASSPQPPGYALHRLCMFIVRLHNGMKSLHLTSPSPPLPSHHLAAQLRTLLCSSGSSWRTTQRCLRDCYMKCCFTKLTINLPDTEAKGPGNTKIIKPTIYSKSVHSTLMACHTHMHTHYKPCDSHVTHTRPPHLSSEG